MYQRALQGYEKAVGLENVARYQPALMTIWNLGNLFATQEHLDKAKEMLHESVYWLSGPSWPSSDQCQRLESSIASLDPTQGK